jgi:hypothetical protein
LPLTVEQGTSLKSLHLEDVHLGLQAFPHRQVVGTDLEPAGRFLIDVQAAADLDDPAVVDADLPVVQVLVPLDLQPFAVYELSP